MRQNSELVKELTTLVGGNEVLKRFGEICSE